ncbi:Fungalysin metallopeptidase-domain-containing protein [Auriculariales sp. MPI-PUGE-AT-0066]|nr:Fungalysin metallopeptidase-domain-containing protein [Auriculariales sp. MPI-PUGE-AT-0066]
MVTLTPSFATLALLCASVIAAPQPRPRAPVMEPHTHRVRSLPNGNSAQVYHPAATFETFGSGVEHPLDKRANFRDAGVAFLGSKFGSETKFKLASTSDGEQSSHVYVSQSFNDIPVANAVANVAVKNGRVVSWGNSFVAKPTRVASAEPKISINEATTAAEKSLHGVRNSVTEKLEYYALDSGEVVLTHVIQIDSTDGHLLEAFIDAETAEVVGINDFTYNLIMDVVPIWKGSPLDGFETLENPEDPLSSPQGWENWNGVESNVTRGNNCYAYKGTSTNFTAESTTNTYDYDWVPASAPSVGANVPKAVANAFYLVNSVHDITYRYGFTESAFNFQQNNFGLGGAQGDPIMISVQDSAGTNNAGITVTADGTSPLMRMYRFTVTTPNRDGSLQNDIVIHEATHGTTNRMTGGGTGRCLQTSEAGGMGEGWSDAFSDWTEQVSGSVVDWATGTYVLNDPAGVRDFVYSTNSTTNPLTYASLRTRTEVHAAGEVWANLLHNVLAALIAEYGYADDARTNPEGTGGNTIYMHLFIDALLLQPCNPTTIQARAAWIQADVNRYDGAHVCLLWKVFASRGYGSGATTTKTDNAAVPTECQ